MNSPENTSRPSTAVIASDLRALIGRLRRRLQEQGTADGLTPSQTAAVIRLDRDGPLTTSALARAEGLRPQSMGTTIAALQEAGLVAATPDPQDGRQNILSLTSKCRAWLETGRSARQDWLMRVIDRELSPEERDILVRSISVLTRMANS